jgi:hypothetical protein
MRRSDIGIVQIFFETLDIMSEGHLFITIAQ